MVLFPVSLSHLGLLAYGRRRMLAMGEHVWGIFKPQGNPAAVSANRCSDCFNLAVLGDLQLSQAQAR
jgi:hypothetical protein